MTEQEYSRENHGQLHAIVQLMKAMMDGAALDRKTASEDRRAMMEAIATERRERTDSIGRVHGRIDDLSETTRRVETGVGTIVEQLRQADQNMRADIAVEQHRPRVALFDGAGAKVVLAALATAAGIIATKAGWVPVWWLP